MVEKVKQMVVVLEVPKVSDHLKPNLKSKPQVTKVAVNTTSVEAALGEYPKAKVVKSTVIK